MTLSQQQPANGARPRRHLETVDELAERYRRPKTSMYEFLRANPAAGVLRLGRRILVDVDVFDKYVSNPGGSP